VPSLRKLVLGIPLEETSFERRGFRGGTPQIRRRFDAIGQAFVAGYHAALDVAPERLPERLQSIDHELRGFAYEGAAMGFAILDLITPWRRDRWRSFIEGTGNPHMYMVLVGAGWAVARMGGNARRFIPGENPMLESLVFDGIGFHDGYFHWPRTIETKQRPERLTGSALRAFDQGLGRSLWFVDGGEPKRIARTIAGFDHRRRPDLWAGVGLAAAYAGGVSHVELIQLREAAGGCMPEVAQGAAFAAEARRRAGNPAPHTDLACNVLCGMQASDAAEITEHVLRDLSAESGSADYEDWRRGIQSRFSSTVLAAHA
jgi:hypothetical protein